MAWPPVLPPDNPIVGQINHTPDHDKIRDSLSDIVTEVDTKQTGSQVDTKITTHSNLADPHTGYQRELEKNSANGYLGLDATGKFNGSFIGNESITATQLANDSVTSNEIATDAVGADEIAPLAVGSTELANTGVTNGKLGSSAVTNNKMFPMATNTIKGNALGGLSNPQDLTTLELLSILDVFGVVNKGVVPASGAVVGNFLKDDGTWATPATGTIITPGVKGDINVVGSNTDWQLVADSVGTTEIASDAVTNAKLAPVSTQTFKARNTAGTGDSEDVTPAVAATMLPAFNSVNKGVVPASGGGTTNYLRADGSFATPPGTGGGSDPNLMQDKSGYVANTTLADPGAGFFRLSSLTIASSINMAINTTSIIGTNLNVLLSKVRPGDFISFAEDLGSPKVETSWARFQITSVANNGTWYQLGLTAGTAGAGSWTSITNFWFIFDPSTEFSGSGITPGLKGDINVVGEDNNWQIVANSVTSNEIATDAVGTLEIAPNAVTNAELATIPTQRIKGRDTIGTGTVEDLTPATVTNMLLPVVPGQKGVAPDPVTATNRFLRDDGTWAATPTSPEHTEYRFDSSTVDADPGTGDVRFNAATRAATTFLYFDDSTNLGSDIRLTLLKITTNDTMYFQIKNNDTSSVRFKASGPAVAATGYVKIPVTIDVAATGAEFTNNAILSVAFKIAAVGGSGGGSGATNLDGLTDVTIASPTDNQVLTYETATSLWKNKTPSGGGGGVSFLKGTTPPSTSIGAIGDYYDNTTLIQSGITQYGPKIATVTLTVTNRSSLVGLRTLTTSAAHGLVAGQPVTIAGVTTDYNGTFVVSGIVSATVFNYYGTVTLTEASVVSAGSVGVAWPAYRQIRTTPISSVTSSGSSGVNLPSPGFLFSDTNANKPTSGPLQAPWGVYGDPLLIQYNGSSYSATAGVTSATALVTDFGNARFMYGTFNVPTLPTGATEKVGIVIASAVATHDWATQIYIKNDGKLYVDRNVFGTPTNLYVSPGTAPASSTVTVFRVQNQLFIISPAYGTNTVVDLGNTNGNFLPGLYFSSPTANTRLGLFGFGA